MDVNDELKNLIYEFQKSQNILTAIGDETRQLIIIALIDAECDPGVRVGEITKKTHLSRPAVSHHLKILKDAKIIKCNRQGTMNYYYLDPDQCELTKLKILFQHVEELINKDKE